jgi:hypothetical protein
MESTLNLDRDFSFATNVSGLQAPTGGKDVPEGFYKAVIADMYVNPEKNAGRIIIKLKITEGPFAGSTRTTGLNIPKGVEDKVRYYWRGLLESCGYTPAQLDAGELSLSADTFMTRGCFIYYNPPASEGDYDTLNFLPPSIWEVQSKDFVPSSAKNTAGNGNGAPVIITPSNGGGTALGSTSSKSDILKRLGMGG